MWATFYERIELGGYEDELPFAEAVFDAYDHGELELPTHFLEGVDGDFEAEIKAMLAQIRAELGRVRRSRCGVKDCERRPH